MTEFSNEGRKGDNGSGEQMGEFDVSPTGIGLAEWRGAVRQMAGALFVLLAATYGYFQSAAQWNENSRFDLTRSLVERGRLDIDPYHRNTQDKARFRGHYYCDKAPGASVFGAVGYSLFYGFRRLAGKESPRQWIRHPAGWVDPRTGRRHRYSIMGYNPAYRRGLAFANLTANVIPTALAVSLLFFVLVVRYRRSLQAALFASLAYGLGSLALPYSTLFYGHQLAASLLVGGWALWELSGQRKGALSGWLRRVGTGLLLAAAVATEYTVAPAAALMGLWMLWKAGERGRTLAGLVLGALPIGLALGGYHWACFGSPFSVGYQHLVDPVFAKGMGQGLLGVRSPDPAVAVALLVGPHRGLLFQTPVLVLAFLGLLWWWRGTRSSWVAVVALVFGYYWMLNASYYMWDGGAALGPRHMIPALGLLAAATAWAYPTGGKPIDRAGRIASWAVAGWSTANMLAATAVGPEAPLGVADPLADYVWPHFVSGRLAHTQGSSNFGLLLGLPGLWSLVPLFVLWALAGLWFFVVLRDSSAALGNESAG